MYGTWIVHVIHYQFFVFKLKIEWPFEMFLQQALVLVRLCLSYF